MDINEITIGQAKELAGLFSSAKENKAIGDEFIGLHVVARTESAGVFFGILKQKAGREVILSEARRLWRWKCVEGKGISLSSIANHGVDYGDSKVVEAVGEIWLEAIEIIPCAIEAIENLREAPNAKAIQ